MAMGNFLGTSKPRLSINDFGYQFKEVDGLHVLRDEEDRRFEFDWFGGDRAKNQNRYENLGEAITEYVYEFLENKLHLWKVTIPVDARLNEPKGFFFMSKDALECDTLMILIHGSGVERAGQWARSLIINASFESGTMVPYIEEAMKEGFGVLITNGNHNYDETLHNWIKGSENPQDHFVYVWNNFIKDAKAKHIVIVAHSFGGVVVLHGLRNIKEAKERIKAVAFTDSVHSVGRNESSDIKQFFKKKTRNWVSSSEELDTPIRPYYEGDTGELVSAGTTEHVWTSHCAKDSVFSFFKEKLNKEEKEKENVLYHYTSEKGAEAISQDKKIKASTRGNDDAVYGQEHQDGNKITVLLDKKTKEKFDYCVYGDKSKNQERYENLGEAVKDYVHDVCLSGNLKFRKIAIPVDAGKKEPQGFFFMSEYALSFKKLIILMHGGDAVRAGQWSRSVIINENLESGTMVPYIEKALEEGFGVILTNGNHNMDSNNRPIQGSESAQDHFVYVWNNFIKDAKAEHIVIVAHSLGGEVVLHGLREIDEAMKRIKAVAFTHSTHTTIKESTAIKSWLKEKTRNWVCSEEPLDTPVKINCKDDCDQVSAGTNKHTMTSHFAKDSVFKFCSEKLSAAEDDSSLIKPTQFSLISKQHRPHELELVYKMTSSRKGLAVIVNINNFQNAKDEKRKGSEKDQQGLVKLFEELDFRTKTLVDLTKEELLSEFQDITKYHFGAYDCLIVCIMSHGDEDYFVACDGGKIKIQSIREMFNNKNCETLCGKPKLFFINACRGVPADPGTVVKESGSKSSVKPQPSPEPKAYTAVENCGRETTAENADILTAFSSVEGYSSFRDEEQGSWFISTLIDVFKENAGVEDVMGMLTLVNKRVNSKGSLGSKQVPEPRNTLTKKVYFWPGMKFQ